MKLYIKFDAKSKHNNYYLCATKSTIYVPNGNKHIFIL